MLALADQGENERQRSTATGKRFTDPYSQLDAFRHPIDERNGEKMLRQCSAVFFDRYAFLMRYDSRFDVIKAYDLDTGAKRFVDLNPKSFRQTCKFL